ncbi:MAG: hypothetical protein AAF487_10315 [Bacteroidota bacterium]
MRKALLFILGFGFCGLVYGQGELYPSFGAEIAVPVSDSSFTDLSAFGLGPAAGIEITVNDQMSFDLQTGFIFLPIKDSLQDLVKSHWMLPVQVGFRYYLDNYTEGLYFKGTAGFHVNSITTEEIVIEVPGFDPTIIPEETESDLSVSFAPVVGYRTKYWDWSLRYNIISQENGISYIGFRAAYALDLRK